MKIGDSITLTEKLWLAMMAGARAIENNKRLHDTTYMSMKHRLLEMPYDQAATILRMVTNEVEYTSD